MRPARFDITDQTREYMEPLLPDTERDRGMTAKDTGYDKTDVSYKASWCLRAKVIASL